MSSCWGSVCLLVVLGVVFTSGSPCHFVTENLTETHDIIADALGLKEPEVGKNGLFSSVVRSISSYQWKEQVELMNATLDIYMRVFSSILQHHHNQNHDETLLDQVTPDTERPQVERALMDLQRKMEMVRSKLRNPKHDGEEVMAMLNKIKVDDVVDQKTALAEYKEVYQAASVIISPRCGRSHSTSAKRRR